MNPPIGPDGKPAVTSNRAIARVERIVALGAQRAHLAQAEEFVIAAMWLDVVCDRRRRDATDLEAQSTQRLDAQLMRPPALPFASCVPLMDSARARHLCRERHKSEDQLTMETKLEQIAAKARCEPKLRFTSLAHHITRDRAAA